MSRSTASPQWASRLGFIFAAAGAAVGLGNLQRFPQVVGENGGGAFLLLYLGCVILFGWPLMMAELALGRAAQRNPVDSFARLAPHATRWRYVGALGIAVAFAILSYYTVACAWMLTYAARGSHQSMASFAQVTQNPKGVLPYLLLFHGITTIIVLRGLNKGIERFSKLIMPLLLFLQVLLIVRVLCLPGSWEGLIYYLKPNFSRLNQHSLLRALSQAFYSLCIGEAVLITYGSFSKKSTSLPAAAGYICAFDTLVACLAGLIVFPAAFYLGQAPNQGTGLIYSVLSQLFDTLPFGRGLQVAYFGMLAIAGLTTCITLLEVVAHTVHQQFHWSKRQCVLALSVLALVLALPSLYGQGAVVWLSQLTFLHARGCYAVMDLIWGDLGMVVVGLLTTLFVGWVWGGDRAARELCCGAPGFKALSARWKFYIKWIAPGLVVFILWSFFRLQ